MKTLAPTLALACLLVAADDPPKKVQKETLATHEPASAAGEGQKYLARFAGEWDVAKAFYPREGPPIRAEGHCRQSMVEGGLFLRSEFTFKQGDKEGTGTGTIGFEPETGLFTSTWVDSRQTRMSFRRSRDRFDGTQIVLHSADLGPETPSGRKSRTVSRLGEGDKTLSHKQYAIAPNGEERLMMELSMTRREAAAGK